MDVHKALDKFQFEKKKLEISLQNLWPLKFQFTYDENSRFFRLAVILRVHKLKPFKYQVHVAKESRSPPQNKVTEN